jgi:phosphopantetheinyl transferase (holo-ACP synthase)
LSKSKDYDQGEVGEGANWIEKSFPVGMDEKVSTKKVDDYNLGISGESFQTGPLGKRMFEAIVTRTELEMSDEIKEAFTLYAMDFTAKEATRAALTQNGMEMALQEEEEDQGMWGDVEAIRLYDEKTGIRFSTMYDSLEEAVKQWTPGQPFDFVARQVPAKIRELSIEELVQALDPDGLLREEAKGLKGEEGASPDEEALLSIFDNNEIASLADMANDNVRRTESAPREATVEGQAFAGLDSKGYRVINRSDLLNDSINADGTENQKSKCRTKIASLGSSRSGIL